MRVLVGLAVCCAMFAAAGCGSGADDASSQEAQRTARRARIAVERDHRQARRAVARAHRQAARRRVRKEAARRRARAEAARVEAQERDRIEAEESEEAEASECDPNYAGACLDPSVYDYDCAGGSGDGPDYTGPVTVVGEDHYGLDSDGDGSGCESY